MLILSLFWHDWMRVFICLLLLLQLVPSCFFAGTFLAWMSLSMLLSLLRAWKVKKGDLFLAFLQTWIIFSLRWNLIFLWQTWILRSVNLLNLLFFICFLLLQNIWWLNTLSFALLYTNFRKASINLVMRKVFLVGELDLYVARILLLHMFGVLLLGDRSSSLRSNILHCNLCMRVLCFGYTRFYFFLLFYVCLYFLIINLYCLITHVNGNAGFCLNWCSISYFLSFLLFLVFNFNLNFFIVHFFLFSLIWSLLPIFFCLLFFKSPLLLFLPLLLRFKQSLIKKMIFFLIDEVRLWQAWLIFEFRISLKCFLELEILLNVILFELFKGHLESFAQFDCNLLLLLENEFVALHILLCVGFEVGAELM